MIQGLAALVQQPRPAWKREPRVLLCPNIPKPMHGVAPRVVLGQAWWDNEREQACRSTDNHCIACGVSKLMAQWQRWLEGHELYETNYSAGRMVYLRTVPLCHFCHNFIHSGRLRTLLERGKVTNNKYGAVIKHGDAVLKQAKLRKPKPWDGPIAEWGAWRLVIGTKEFPPLYKDFEAWLAAMEAKT